MSKVDAFVAIQSHIVDDTPLTETHQKIYERWSAAFTLLCKYKIKSIAVQQLMEQYELSQAQAYRDVSDAERAFGNTRKYHKEALRYMIIEAAFKDIEEFDERARLLPKGETPGVMELRHWEIAKKLKQEALKTIIKAGGLDKDDIEVPDFSKLQTPDIQISLNSEAVGLLQELLSGGVVDLENVRELLGGQKNKSQTKFDDAEILE